ncbi:Flp pilus assembly complex ATPase component TadA [Candidatus Saccharibacteria bacterium]|nr:Flp pilus assembly complex ATPase component TadA [Candidatus Saccharibacteria bacterium]
MNEQEIQEKRRDNEEAATQNRAKILGLPYLDTRSFENTIPLVPNVIDKSEMHDNYIIPLQKGGNEEHYQFMVTSQTPRSVIDKMIQNYANYGEKVDFFLISLSGYNVFMLRYDPPREIHYDDIKIASDGDSETLASVSQTLNSVGTDKVFDFLLDQADKLGASDIHIENLRDAIRIRMRVDGILHPVANINRDRYRIFMGELSSRAGVSTAATTPQSGHMQKDIFVDGVSHLLNIRVETIPTMYGQDAVLRLFNFDESLLNLDLLGLTEEELTEIRDVVSHPRGLVLMVGPTGSGKSTTLYSIINALNSTDRKIITLEDPIEYGITGISQIPIDTTGGGSFADGLRSVLRLDPDVVMVGEIRDGDTAKTAIQASITGHLVLSSFHANTTAAAFSRMIDLIGTNPIFSSSIRMVIAQRLVRHLSDSKQEYTPDEATKRYVSRVLEGLSRETISEKIGFDFDPDNYKLYKAVPGGEEDPFGYKGRTVIMEQLSVTEDIQKYIRGDVEDINTDAIEKTAKDIGMITLEQKGVLAALRGDTTLDEIARVI